MLAEELNISSKNRREHLPVKVGSLNVASSSADEIIDHFFQFTSSFQSTMAQEHISGEKRGRRARLTTYPTSVSRISRYRGILDISQISTARYRDCFFFLNRC
jgi:hypothetical protein